MRALLAVVIVGSLSMLSSVGAAQAPEDRGGLTVMEWDAGAIATEGASIRRRVLYPDGGGPYPLVGVIHGASRTGAQHIELARTLASWGFVVVLPDMPCGFAGCDHDANALQIAALLEWAVAQSADGASRIAGLVDPERRGLIGHSWGALASHLTAARNPQIDSVVLFDPNDDGTVGRDATATITAPELQLLAEVPGTCNSQWMEAAITPMLPDPHLQMTIDRSAHCDAEEPGDVICPFACGAGDASTSTFFRRYAVAWTLCVLTADARMASWLTTRALDADPAVTGIVSSGLEALPCASTTPGDDAGPSDVDASVELDAASDADGGVTTEDGGTTAIDASTTRGDASVRTDGGGSPTETAGGCGCVVLGARAHASSAWLVLVGLALVLRVRSSRRERRATERASRRRSQAFEPRF
jgi:dienelactone hydrolase